MPTWIVIGASRGIGLELVRQLLSKGDNQVIAAVRDPTTANQLWQVTASQSRPASCLIEQCDVTSPPSIDEFVGRIKVAVQRGLQIDNIILNAGVLKYPNRATEMWVANTAQSFSFSDFALHLHTNTIGPIICAQQLMNLNLTSPPSKLVFISSDSGSTTLFRDHEDGFGAYAASKAALNQMLRHMAAELKRRGDVWENVCVMALHPGEVQTDMANIDVDWDIEGIIQADESVRGMLEVINKKSHADSGTFWCWDGRPHPWIPPRFEQRQGQALIAGNADRCG